MLSLPGSLPWIISLLFALCALDASGAKFGDVGASLLQLKADSNELLALVPQPKSIQLRTGSLHLQDASLSVTGPSSLLQTVQEFLAPEAREVSNAQGAELEMKLMPEADLAEEAYRLNISDHIILEARSEHGLFNGLMTLRQLMVKVNNGWTLPKVEIQDEPSFKWRGLMLDVSRHFFEKDAVKHLLKTMALFKMNHFHWHLTDDQGWRFPVAKYPKLIRLGAFRRATQLGHSALTDGTPYNQSYTEEEIHEILSLAESLHIEVMPEFDIPGHSQALIASYPEMGNFDISSKWAPEVATKFGALQYTLSPSERSRNFTKDVLGEMAHLFQHSPYIHIGGDEVPTAQWAHSPLAKQVAKAEHVSLERLEGVMLAEASEHLEQLGRKAVVWDDALDGGSHLPRDSVVMIWRSWEGLDHVGDKAAMKGHKVVLAPQAYTYLDQWQDHKHQHFDAIGGFLPLSTVYRTPVRAGHAEVLGVQGQLWSEYIREGGRNLDYMAWPRGCALAEVGWSGERRPRFSQWRKRLEKRLEDFRLFDINLGEM